jgi:hypothetical protein
MVFAMSATLHAQEQPPSAPSETSQESPPPPAEAPSDPEPAEGTEEVGEDDGRLSVAEMKALSDDDLRTLYLETPWRLPDDFGEDEDLLERVLRIAHPEIEPAPAQPETSAETTPKKPQPNEP